jgi:NADP-dependent 3-hydroxy acid dehydrogenase YdfG
VITVVVPDLCSVDILVTWAGSSPGGLLENLTEEQWMASLNLKFMGYIRSVRAIIGHMRERGAGAIVLVVGNDGLKPSYWEMTAGVANAADRASFINGAHIPVDGAQRKAIMDS